ncbi:hypothetical protein LHV16_18720, partial [Providencia rettgeri]
NEPIKKIPFIFKITPASYGTFYIFIIIFITTQLVLIRKPRIMRDFLTIKPLVIYLVGLL